MGGGGCFHSRYNTPAKTNLKSSFLQPYIQFWAALLHLKIVCGGNVKYWANRWSVSSAVVALWFRKTEEDFGGGVFDVLLRRFTRWRSRGRVQTKKITTRGRNRQRSEFTDDARVYGSTWRVCLLSVMSGRSLQRLTCSTVSPWMEVGFRPVWCVFEVLMTSSVALSMFSCRQLSVHRYVEREVEPSYCQQVSSFVFEVCADGRRPGGVFWLRPSLYSNWRSPDCKIQSLFCRRERKAARGHFICCQIL